MPKNVNCPVRGHTHTLPLEMDPSSPDMVLARCGERIVYRTAARDHLDEARARLDLLTVTELKGLPQWDVVESPRPTRKDEIINAILEIGVPSFKEEPTEPFEYSVPTYKE